MDENKEVGAVEEKFCQALLPKVSPWQVVVSKEIMSDTITSKFEPATMDSTVYTKRKYDKKKSKRIKWMPLLMDDKTETVDIKKELEDYSEIKKIEKFIIESVENEDGFIILNYDDLSIKQETASHIDETNGDIEITEQQSSYKQTQNDLYNNNVKDDKNRNSNDSETSNSYDASDSDYDSYAESSDSDKRSITKKKKNIYTCAECKFTGVYRDYRIHIQECPLRGRGKSKKSVDKASKSDQDSWPEYHCSKCMTTFSKMKQYLQHLTLTHHLTHAVCPKCGEKMKNLAALQSHIMWHIEQTFDIYRLARFSVWIFQCRECTKNLVRDEFFSHWETHVKFVVNDIVTDETDPARVRNYYKVSNKKMVNLLFRETTRPLRSTKLLRFKTCIVCNLHFSNINDCRNHLIEHLIVMMDAYALSSRANLKTFICPYRWCKREVDKLDHMRIHVHLLHAKCEICCWIFRDYSEMIKHMKMHEIVTGGGACKFCATKFQTDRFLRRHVEMHFTTKPINCCDGHFSFQAQLKRHIRNKHDM